VLIPPLLDTVPEQIPDTTKSGNPTLRRLGKRERNDFYVLVLYGHVLATVRETLAVAPGIQSVRAIALRVEGRSAYGAPKLGCVLATRFTRRRLEQVHWDTTEAAGIVTQTATEHLLSRGGPAHDVLALDLTGEPDLQALLQAVTTDDDNDAGQSAPQDTARHRAADERLQTQPPPRTAPPAASSTGASARHAATPPSAARPEPSRPTSPSSLSGAGRALRAALKTTGSGREQLRRLLDSGADPSTLRAPMQQIAQQAIDSTVEAMEETKNQVVEGITAGGERAHGGSVGEHQLRCGMDMLTTALGTGRGLDATEVCDGILAGLRMLELAQRSAATGQPAHPATHSDTPTALTRAAAALAAGRQALAELAKSGAAAGTLNAQTTLDTATSALTEISREVFDAARSTGAREQTGRAALPYIRRALTVIKAANESMRDRGAATYFDQVETLLDLLHLAHAQLVDHRAHRK
jgi:hypothetical protein